ncbi:hypothetical protein Mycch_1246 [Mycolicibacterium chubuense NBB4]|uniref:PPE family protein PPE42 n=1 Tax=Mycolicibacterium chubuense (strain NBB4) TaxID=710421 RepID=I4BFJ7_MYCCN|nr:hypothetical protein [Mycolicibacterium chubuense]AFM16054.1 hypothetical protein Mycch_1246 [Mycolicibacterium chubuense NBB4]
MRVLQSVCTAGVTAVLGASIALAPADHSPPRAPIALGRSVFPVALSSATLPVPLSLLPIRLLDKPADVARSVPPRPHALVTVTPSVAPEASVDVAAASVGNAIINVYNAVEPWVRWGFDVAQYAVGWIPVVGWLAPQIGIFYDFFESIAQSATYNFAYWIDGSVTFGEGVRNVARDSWNALVQLGRDELNWILPPLPPWPPVFRSSAVATEQTMAAEQAVQTDAAPAHPLKSRLASLRDSVRAAKAAGDTPAEPADATTSTAPKQADTPTETAEPVTKADKHTTRAQKADATAPDTGTSTTASPKPKKSSDRGAKGTHRVFGHGVAASAR